MTSIIMDCGARPNKYTLYVTAAAPWQLCTVLHLAVHIERRTIGWCYVVNATLILFFAKVFCCLFEPSTPPSQMNSQWRDPEFLLSRCNFTQEHPSVFKYGLVQA